MYEPHFRLRPLPFAETVDPSSYVPLPSRDTALRRLRFGLERGPGAVLLTGPSGSGKSLLARVLADAMADQGPSTFVTFPALPADEMLSWLADEMTPLSSGPSSRGPSSSLRRIQTTLTDASGRGQVPLLVIDEAHLITDAATFESLRLLLNITAASGRPALRLVLIGNPDLAFQVPPALADRLSARCQLGPLDEPETAAYVRGRLAAASESAPADEAPALLFAPDALRALHLAADGLPRRLNRLADLALLITYARDQPAPGPDTITLATREADLEPVALA
jgi:type II secretory pathway predicted ATPase ExeA